MKARDLVRCVGHVVALKAAHNARHNHSKYREQNIYVLEQHITELISFLAAGARLELAYLPLLVRYLDQLETAREPLLIDFENADALVCVLFQLVGKVCDDCPIPLSEYQRALECFNPAQSRACLSELETRVLHALQHRVMACRAELRLYFQGL